MDRFHLALLPLCLLSALACDRISLESSTDPADAQQALAAERPDGWESLEDPESASRLYYQFVDGKGRVRFVERIDEVPEAWRANVGFVKMAVPPPLSPGDALRARSTTVASRTAAAGSAGATQADIVLYSAEWCGACKKAKRYLSQNDVDFEVRDVDNPHIAKELVQKTGQRSIPVIDVGGRVFTGFDPGAYEQLTRGA